MARIQRRRLSINLNLHYLVGIATLIFRYFLRYFSSTHRTDLSKFRGTSRKLPAERICADDAEILFQKWAASPNFSP